jgi:hypothetical protein
MAFTVARSGLLWEIHERDDTLGTERKTCPGVYYWRRSHAATVANAFERTWREAFGLGICAGPLDYDDGAPEIRLAPRA